MKVFIIIEVADCRPLSLMFQELCKNYYLVFQGMVNKFAVLKCNEKKPSEKFHHFSLRNAELNKQWILFVNKRDRLATNHSMLCELYFEKK